MKKFYSTVTTTPSEQGWILHLDGKPVKTPGKSVLLIPNANLAETVCQEWKSQKDEVVPDTMPATQMLMTVIDCIIPNREKLQNEILDYIDTDLICYFTDDPEVYADAQKESWTPFLKWIEKFFGTAPQTTSGLSALTQKKELHKLVAEYVGKLDDHAFACLYQITTLTGSIFLGLAFMEGEFTNTEIFRAALVEDLVKDKIYLAETYGISPDQDKKRKILEAELGTCRMLLSLYNQA